MDRPMWNYITSIMLLLIFLGSASTGVFKFLLLYGLLGSGAKNLPLFLINTVHDWSGIIMSLLVLIHLILNWNFISTMTKKIFKKILKKSTK